MCVCIYWLETVCERWTRFLFSLPLIGNCLSIRPNVLENNQISIQIYIWDEKYAHALFIYTCVVKIHAIANSGPFSLCTYFSLAIRTHIVCFSFLQRRGHYWFDLTKPKREATANNFALWLGHSCSAIYQCRSILPYQTIHPFVRWCVRVLARKIQSQKDRTAILSYIHQSVGSVCAMPCMRYVWT